MTITATILDNKTKKPIPNVNVRFNEIVVAQTDANGKFSLTRSTIADDDVIELTFVGYDLYFAPAKSFPAIVYLDNRGFALQEVFTKTHFIKTNWFLWLGLGIGATAIAFYAYKQNSKKTPIKAKI